MWIEIIWVMVDQSIQHNAAINATCVRGHHFPYLALMPYPTYTHAMHAHTYIHSMYIFTFRLTHTHTQYLRVLYVVALLQLTCTDWFVVVFNK